MAARLGAPGKVQRAWGDPAGAWRQLGRGLRVGNATPCRRWQGGVTAKSMAAKPCLSRAHYPYAKAHQNSGGVRDRGDLFPQRTRVRRTPATSPPTAESADDRTQPLT